MGYSEQSKYTKDHEWISLEGDVGTIGITSYAVEQLGDVVHLELPDIGTSLSEGESFGTVESTKTVSDLYMPVDGEVLEINQALLDAPEELAQDPHNQGWLIKVKVTSEGSNLMDAKSYADYVETESQK